MNALSPGHFRILRRRKHEMFMQKLGSKNPMNRIGQPDELKGAVASALFRCRQLYYWTESLRGRRMGDLVKCSGSLA